MIPSLSSINNPQKTQDTPQEEGDPDKNLPTQICCIKGCTRMASIRNFQCLRGFFAFNLP